MNYHLFQMPELKPRTNFLGTSRNDKNVFIMSNE
jgi:hypothetical protein